MFLGITKTWKNIFFGSLLSEFTVFTHQSSVFIQSGKSKKTKQIKTFCTNLFSLSKLGETNWLFLYQTNRRKDKWTDTQTDRLTLIIQPVHLLGAIANR